MLIHEVENPSGGTARFFNLIDGTSVVAELEEILDEPRRKRPFGGLLVWLPGEDQPSAVLVYEWEHLAWVLRGSLLSEDSLLSEAYMQQSSNPVILLADFIKHFRGITADV